MCQHRTEVPRVETGIERHWREERERDEAERARFLYEALRPMTAEQMHTFHGYHMAQMQQNFPGYGGIGSGGFLRGILGGLG